MDRYPGGLRADGGTGMNDGSGLSAGQVARRLGVAVTTVRTWDRRYGLGPARRQQGTHRRYHADDVQRLELMRRLVTDGVPPAEAARVARSARLPGASAAPASPTALPEDASSLDTMPSAASPDELLSADVRLLAPPAVATDAARSGASPQVRGLRQAALALDVGQLDRILARAVTADVVGAWTRLTCPALRDIGRRHTGSGRYVEVEHLLSRAVSTALARIERPNAAPTVLLACAPDEQHTLPLEALAAALGVRGTASRMFGARVPAAALATALARSGPRAVVLWSHAADTADTRQVEAALAARPRPALVAVGGPGWDPDRLPAGVRMPVGLAQALDQIAEVTPLAAAEGLG